MTRLFLSSLLLPVLAFAKDTFTPFEEGKVPQSAIELWGKLDLQSEALDVEVVKEWKEEGAVCRVIRYTACTVKGTPCRIAAFYIFPEGAKNAPAFVWAHGGGQRAEKKRGLYFAKQGYATIDINWGGREMVEGVETNTDWGKVDPSQGPKFYPGALRPSVKLNLNPDEHTIDPVPSPRNGNWFLLAYAARRGITFLEQQPEVDPESIGLTGYSMGGNITSYCAIDPRLKAVAPMVGGTGFLVEDFAGLPGSSNIRQYKHPELFARTVDSAAFFPHVKCPVLFTNATNDFHGIFERGYHCGRLMPHENWQATYSLHFNHSLRAEQWLTLLRWFDHHLKDAKATPFPSTAKTSASRDADGQLVFAVTPDAQDLASVEILYSQDPNPRSRFWKTAPAEKKNGTWTATIKTKADLPLRVFGQCVYQLPETREAFQGSGDTYSITTRLHEEIPEKINLDSLLADAQAPGLFHDFTKNGITGWGWREQGGGLRSYALQDPAFLTPKPDQKLVVELGELEGPILFRVFVSKHEWLGTSGPKASYIYAGNLKPGPQKELLLSPSDFKLQGSKEGETMKDWNHISSLSLNLIGQVDGQHVDRTQDEAGKLLKKLSWR